MSDRFLCIHGHFYQPPRENPWLEAIERQDSAHPYHDWNERITAECYAPNAAARILDERARIKEITNNYGWMSFNFGPTLLSWMEQEEPAVYQKVLEADRLSAERFGGHGSAIAQAYNHIILPLASRRDKAVQVRWGIRDFEARFGRRPEGMWLPETAVDLETLDVLAAEGIAFTILAPHQADQIAEKGSDAWTPFQVEADTGRAYTVSLPSGKSIAVFFYDGSTSRAVAFERLLNDGAGFAARLMGGFEGKVGPAPLMHIATDGETYGHHHRHGDMALAFALKALAEREDVRLTNYGEYLELNPPTYEARIREATSWSCAHGVERWRSDCGCVVSPGGSDWTQAWRAPLRASLDWLRDQLRPHIERETEALLGDAAKARDRYIDVILDRSEESLQRFFKSLVDRDLGPEEIERALTLLEMERQTQLMYTSCGWFFDDVSGIEPSQVLQYAGRAIQLAGRVGLDELAIEEAFLDRLEGAHSNIPEAGDGRLIYYRAVEGARVDRGKAGAHYAISSLFEEHEQDEVIYCFRFQRRDQHQIDVREATLLIGRVEVTSLVTRSRDDLSYAVLHLGNHEIMAGVRKATDAAAFKEMFAAVTRSFQRTDFAAVVRVMDREFKGTTYSLRSLFADSQRRVVERILQASIAEAESTFVRLYEERATLLRFLSELSIPRPQPFLVAAEYVINTKLQRILEQPEPHLPAVRLTLEEAAATGVPIDAAAAAYSGQHALEREMDRLLESPRDRRRAERAIEMARVLQTSALPVDLWTVQNRYFDLLRVLGAEPGEGHPLPEAIHTLGDVLNIAVPPTHAAEGGVAAAPAA